MNFRINKIAWVLLLIFTTVQVVPGLKTILRINHSAVVFNVDEEKHAEKSTVDCQKEKKLVNGYQQLAELLSKQLDTAFHIAEQILPAPCLEQLTPPPNCQAA